MLELVLKLKGYLVDKHQMDVGPTLADLIQESIGE